MDLRGNCETRRQIPLDHAVRGGVANDAVRSTLQALGGDNRPYHASTILLEGGFPGFAAEGRSCEDRRRRQHERGGKEGGAPFPVQTVIDVPASVHVQSVTLPR